MKLFFLKGMVALLLASTVACNSKEKKQKEAAIAQAKVDSTRLVYNANNADLKIDAFMKNLHSKAAFNGNVLIAKDGKILYQNTFGWANYLKRDSLKIDDKFELASRF
ncbi:CubicO group peptidase (beta-lactamase class C family) [Sphingobacterium zeae]|uniref:CubicO group peptidase (Beta-lactamase class C family) n=1 Tax=Sphingobacterium zeae TaxID=1776859 RepID=A0ABU0UCM8_9SPHI|nr:hypothetical protein [Sphingobacterium zeae]MDQ1152594.1 CubicO group peptidase (beta-lactamase class C family) [Sphingobacterium zeae]